jgi:hypothetical protein
MIDNTQYSTPKTGAYIAELKYPLKLFQIILENKRYNDCTLKLSKDRINRTLSLIIESNENILIIITYLIKFVI